MRCLLPSKEQPLMEYPTHSPCLLTCCSFLSFTPCAFVAVVQNVRADWQEEEHVMVSYALVSFVRGPIIGDQANMTQPAKVAV